MRNGKKVWVMAPAMLLLALYAQGMVVAGNGCASGSLTESVIPPSAIQKAVAGVGEPRQGGDAIVPVRPEVEQKMKRLHVPFIVNEGQVDGQVKYYANTFAGSVFVTKDGDIVYALPSGRDVPAGASPSAARTFQESGRGHEAGWPGSRGAEGQGGKVGWHGQAPLVRAESAFVVNGYSSLLRVDNANCPPDRILAKSLIAAYLPELQKSTGRDTGTVSLRAAYPPGLQEGAANPVGTRCPCPSRLAHLSNLLSGAQNGADKRGGDALPGRLYRNHSNPNILPANPQSPFQNPQSTPRGVSLKETLVGATISQIQGDGASSAKVSYFKGNNPSQWKNTISTFELVNMGEVYNGIDLKLRAYGNNVEKLFTVKPGANPGQIKIRLDGIKSSPVLVETHCYASLPQSHKETHGDVSSQSQKETHINASLHDHQFIFERGLSVNEHGELVAETELGAVKFTKPVAYQEISGKRVEMDVE